MIRRCSRAFPSSRARAAFTAVDGLSTMPTIGPDTSSSSNAPCRIARAVRAVLGVDKVFACPGRCGTCTPKGHACGSRALTGVPIVIATHA